MHLNRQVDSRTKMENIDHIYGTYVAENGRLTQLSNYDLQMFSRVGVVKARPTQIAIAICLPNLTSLPCRPLSGHSQILSLIWYSEGLGFKSQLGHNFFSMDLSQRKHHQYLIVRTKHKVVSNYSLNRRTEYVWQIIYMKNPPFNSLVWGLLRLAPNIFQTTVPQPGIDHAPPVST